LWDVLNSVKNSRTLLLLLFFLLSSFIAFSQPFQILPIAEASSGFQEEFEKSSPSTTVNDWPMLGRDLWHTGYSQSTSPDTNSTLWTYGQGSGNIAIAYGRVYSGSMGGNVFCLDAFTGELKWNFNTGGYVYGAPAVSNCLVFIGSADSQYYCLNASTGMKKWSFATGGLGDSSPAVSNGRVYFGSRDKKVYCLDRDSGNLIWQFATGDLIELSSPAIDDGKLFICSWDGGIYCLNASTGSSIWTYSTSNKIYGSPTVSEGLVFVGATNLYCINETSGALIWSKSGGGDVVTPTAVYGNKLFWGSSSALLCLNKYNGTLIWSYQKPVNPRTFIAVGGNKVFFLGTDKNLYSVNAENGALVWYFNNLPTTYGCHPAIAYGNLYIASDSKLYCFGSTVQPVTYSLNLRTLDWSGNTLLSSTVNVIGVGSRVTDSSGWTNFTNIFEGTYTVNVFWKGSKVNQTTLTVGTTDVNLDVKCHVWGLDVNAKDGSGKLLPSENTRMYITFPNRTHAISSNINPINYKLMNGTYYFAVKWQNSWVYGNTSVYLDVNAPSIDLSCKVFSLQLDFKDDDGKDLYSDPARYSLTYPNGSKIERLSSLGFGSVQNGTYTISEVIWQGVDITPVVSSIVVSSNTLWTVNCRVYDVDLKIVDRYNNPIGNSRVEAKLANGTTRVYTTNSSGFIPQISQLQTGQILISCSNETKVFLANKSLSIVRHGLYVLKYVTYQLTIQVLDSSGNSIVNQPIEITFNNGTTRSFNLNETGYWSNKDVPEGTMSWSIYFHETKTNSTTINLQKDSLITSRCKVYPLTLAFTDWNGTSTIAPTSYSISLPNGTTFTGRTVLYYSQVQTGEVTISSIVWEDCDVTPVDKKLTLTSPTNWNIKCRIYELTVIVTDPIGIVVSDASIELIRDGQIVAQGLTDNSGKSTFELPWGDYQVKANYRGLSQTLSTTLTASTAVKHLAYLSNATLMVSGGTVSILLASVYSVNILHRRARRKALIKHILNLGRVDIPKLIETFPTKLVNKTVAALNQDGFVADNEFITHKWLYTTIDNIFKDRGVANVRDLANTIGIQEQYLQAPLQRMLQDNKIIQLEDSYVSLSWLDNVILEQLKTSGRFSAKQFADKQGWRTTNPILEKMRGISQTHPNQYTLVYDDELVSNDLLMDVMLEYLRRT